MNVQSVDLKTQTITAQKQSENIVKNQFLVIFYSKQKEMTFYSHT